MHTRFHVFTLRALGVVGLLLSGGAFAEEPSLQARLDQVIEKALADKRIVGAVVLVAQDGQVVYHRAAGEMDREAHKPMREDTIFRLASMSKTLVSAAALALVEQGKLGLDEPITRWLPTFRPTLEGGRPASITVRQLLTHTSGLGYTVNEPEGGPYHQAGASDGLDQPGLGMEENLRRIASVPLAFEPGTQWKYSFAIDVLGAVVARASGMTLPKAVERLVTRPLGLSDTGFSVREPARLSIPYADGKPEPVRMGESYAVSYVGAAIRFTPGRVFDARSFPSGGGGMVSTAGDYLKFLEAIRKGGAPMVKPETAAQMITNQVGPLESSRPGWGSGWGFGFGGAVLVDPVKAHTPHSAGTWQWGGAYGHSWFVDPQRRLSVVALTNTTFEGMSGAFPKEIVGAVYGSAATK